MSLATRCTACGTVFRVVQDQLKVSEGWVRCGRCGEVFNAIEGLFDLEGTSGPIPLAHSPRDLPAAEPPLREAEGPAPQPEPAPAAGPPPDAEPETVTPTETQIDTEADARGASGFGRSRPISRFDDVDLIDSVVPEDAVSAPHAGDEPPGFLRDADAQAQWQRPRVQRSLWLLCALMALVLAAQVGVRQRAEIAARWPGSLPLLHALCGALGCTLEAPRRLDALAVDSSGLTRVEGAPLYRLQVALRNRAETSALMPAFDLTLTNLRGEVVARRVLRASDFATRLPEQIGPGAELPIEAVLDVGENRIAGYTIELFYP
jgi:predicted Zn finger-like uncharacterized protein